MTTTTRERIKRLSRLFVPFLLFEVAAQLAALLVGFAVVRVLSIHDFAIYALVTALQGTLAVLSDTGISAVLIARAGAIHSDRTALGELVAAGKRAREVLEVVVLLLTAPILPLWLWGKGLSQWELLILIVLVALGLHLQVTAGIFSALPVVLLEPRRLQLAQIMSSLGRLGFVIVVLATRPSFIWMLGANVFGLLVLTELLKLYARQRIDLSATPGAAHLREFKLAVRRGLVPSLYFAFSSQITLWLIGLTGSARSIAEVGALGRLGNVLAVAQSALSTLVAPRLSREVSVKRFARRYASVATVVAASGLLLVGAAFAVPGAFLDPRVEVFPIDNRIALGNRQLCDIHDVFHPLRS